MALWTPSIWVPPRGAHRPSAPYELNFASPLADGLVGFYPFAHNAPTEDLSQQRHDLAYASTTDADMFSPDAFMGNGWRFDASTDRWNNALAHPALGRRRSLLTLAAWVKVHSFSNNVGFGFNSAANAAGVSNGILQMRGTAQFRCVSHGDTIIASGSTGRNTEQLYLVGATVAYTTQGETQVYVDGLADGSLATGAVTDDALSHFIQVHGTAGSWSIYSFMVWNRILSAGEMYALWDPATRHELYLIRPSLARFFFHSGGATQYTSTVSGALAPAGATAKQTATAKAATQTTTGTLLKQAQPKKTGTLTTAGTLTAVRTVLATLTAALTTAGTLTKQTGKVIAASVPSAGSLTKRTARAMSAALTTAGALTKQVRRSLGASLATIGALLASTGNVVFKQFKHRRGQPWLKLYRVIGRKDG